MPITRHDFSAADNAAMAWGPVLPAGITRGMLIVVPLANKLSTHVPTMQSPGYIKGAEYTGGAGVDAENSGPIRITVWYKIAEGNESGQTLSITTPSPGNSGVCRPIVYAKGDGMKWVIQFAKGKDDIGASTIYSAESDTVLDLLPEDWVLCLTAQTDGTQSSNATLNGNGTSAPNVIFSNVTKPFDNRTSFGNNTSLLVTEATVATGNASANITTKFTFSATPSNSAGVSGATVFMKLRTVKPIDVQLRSSATFAQGTSSVVIPYPSGIQVGDILILNTASKTSECRPTTPNGFIRIKESLSSHDGGGTDLGAVLFNTWYKIADESDIDNVAITLQPSAQASTISGQMLVFSRDLDFNVVIDVVDGGHNFASTIDNATLNWSAKANNPLKLRVNDFIISASAANTDNYNYDTLALTTSGVTLEPISSLYEQPVTTGNKAEHFAAWWKVTAPTQDVTAVPTFTANATGTAALRRPSGQTHFIRIRQTSDIVTDKPSCALIMDPNYQDNSTINANGGVWGYGQINKEKDALTTTDPAFTLVTRSGKKFFTINRNFQNGVAVADGGLGLPVERRAEYYLRWQPRTQQGTKRNVTWELEIENIPAPVLQYIIFQDHPGRHPDYTSNHPLCAIEICKAMQYPQDDENTIYPPAGAMVVCQNTLSGKARYSVATHNNVPYLSGGTPIMFTGTKRIRIEHLVKYGTAGNARLFFRIKDITNNLEFTYDNNEAATVASTPGELGSLPLVGGAFKHGAYFHQIDNAANCKTMVDNGFSTYTAYYKYWAYAERQPTDFDYANVNDDFVFSYLNSQVN